MPLVAAALLALLSFITGAGAQTVDLDIWGSTPTEHEAMASWYGNSGLIVVPTARIASPTRLNGGLHRIDVEGEAQDVYNANVALTADLEVGIARLRNVVPPGVALASVTDETVVSAKYNLDLGGWFGLPGVPEIAVGVWDISDQLNRAIYLVGSYTFNLADEGTLSQLSIHLGFGDTERDAGAFDGIFGGVEFVPFPRALVQVEYDAEEFNGALRYFPTPWLSLDVGSVDGDFAYGASVRTVF